MIEPKVRKELVENLRKYADRLNSTAKIENFPDPVFQKKIDTIEGNSLVKNLALKTMLAEYLESCKNKKDVYFWIINKWGGIGSFKEYTPKGKSNLNKIEDFLKKLEESKNDEMINSISSLSKVSSFVNPKEYFIYDSRAVFSLNWLLYKSGEDKQFYYQPIPQGGVTNKKGKKIAAYRLNEIIYDNKQVRVPRGVNYEQYKSYCYLIKDLYYDVFSEDKQSKEYQPYKMEMLLFWIAPQEILTEIDKEFCGSKYDHSNLIVTQHTTKTTSKSSNNSLKQERFDNAPFWKILENHIPTIMKNARIIDDNRCDIKLKNPGGYILRMRVYSNGFKKNGYQAFGIDNLKGENKIKTERNVKRLFGNEKIDVGKSIIIRNMNPEYDDERKKIKWFAENIQKIIDIIE